MKIFSTPSYKEPLKENFKMQNFRDYQEGIQLCPKP